MIELEYEQLLIACRPGGSTNLSSVTPLEPAAGPHATIAPAKVVRGRSPSFAHETRFIDGHPMTTVVVSSKQDSLNRVEDAISDAIRNGDPLLGRIPRLRVTYPDGKSYTDLHLSHRAFDGHFRAGTIDGVPTTEHTAYRAARDATPNSMRALLDLSPITLVLGGWDSTRRTNQVRCRSALVGEVIGVLADQSPTGTEPDLRGGARVDPVGASVQLSKADATAILDRQADELSPKLVTKLREQIRKAKTGATISGAALGLGALPPTLDALGGVACSSIIRSHVLSFSTLRQYHFGGTPEGDASLRALLAALALAGLARSDAELHFRANCDLVESAAPQVLLDARYGERVALSPISIETSDRLLAAALDDATETAGLNWHGQILEIAGDPALHQSLSADTEDQDDAGAL